MFADGLTIIRGLVIKHFRWCRADRIPSKVTQAITASGMGGQTAFDSVHFYGRGRAVNPQCLSQLVGNTPGNPLQVPLRRIRPLPSSRTGPV